jgi:hypothetical protein
MSPADRKASIERVDNGWILVFWTRDRSEMTERREVYTNLNDVFGRVHRLLLPNTLNLPAGDAE